MVDRQRLAVTLGEHLSLALANFRLRASLRERSTRDELTGLFNRRFLEEALDREIRRAVRENRPLGLMMIDLDHFKRLNDTFGHAAGDFVLRLVGDYLQEQRARRGHRLPLRRRGVRDPDAEGLGRGHGATRRGASRGDQRGPARSRARRGSRR